MHRGLLLWSTALEARPAAASNPIERRKQRRRVHPRSWSGFSIFRRCRPSTPPQSRSSRLSQCRRFALKDVLCSALVLTQDVVVEDATKIYRLFPFYIIPIRTMAIQVLPSAFSRFKRLFEFISNLYFRSANRGTYARGVMRILIGQII